MSTSTNPSPVFVHVYSREDDIFLADRVAQASEALNFIRRCSATSGAVVDIYAGDFNSERGDLPYRLLMILGGFTEEGGDTPTYAARTSSYGLEKLRPQVLDYVMHRASQEGWATTTARVWRPLPQRVPGNEFRCEVVVLHVHEQHVLHVGDDNCMNQCLMYDTYVRGNII